jgi:hypothetical protein
VALAGLLVLSGCSTVDLGGGAPSETVTPAPVPETTPPLRLAPGVTRGGVTRPLVLAGAHSDALGERYALRLNWTVRAPDGRLLASADQHVRTTPDQFLATFRLRGRPGFLTNGERMDAAFWSNGSTLVGRTRAGNDTGDRYLNAGLYDGGGAGFYRSLRRPKPWRDHRSLFAAIDTRVAGRQETADGTDYIVVGDRIESPGMFAAATGVDEPRNVSLRTVISQDGVIRRLHLRYAGVHPFRGRVVVNRTVTYSEIGTVERVRRPAWVAQVTETVDEDRRDREDEDEPMDGEDEPMEDVAPAPTAGTRMEPSAER